MAYHDGDAKRRGSLVLFERKLGYKVSADRAVLTQLLLEPFRIPFEVSQYPVVRGYEYGRNIY